MGTFSPQADYTPSTQADYEDLFYLATNTVYKSRYNKDPTAEHYKATTMYLLDSQVVAPQLVLNDENTARSIASIYAWFEGKKNQINSGGGVVYDAFERSVLGDEAMGIEKLADGVNVVTRIEDPTLGFGQVGIHFDNADTARTDLLDGVFRKLGICITTRNEAGMTPVVIARPRMNTSRSDTYYYSNLLPADYTQLAIRIRYRFGQDSRAVSEAELVALFEERWADVMKIGQNLEPDQLMGTQVATDPIARFVVEHKLEGEPDGAYVSTVRTCGAGQRFAYSSVAALLL